MKHLKKLNEDIEWTMWRSHEADEYLRMIFTDFINPMDSNRKESKVNKVRSGYNLMLFWELTIPLEDKATSVEKYLASVTSLCDKLLECLDKTKIEIPDIRHCIELVSNKSIKLTLWTK